MIHVLVIVAAIASTVSTWVYVRDMFKGQTKPNRVSWLMWSVQPLIATAAAVSTGVTWAAVPVFMAGFLCFLVFIVAVFVPGAYWRLSAFDYACGFLALMAIGLWVMTKEPALAVLFSLLGDTFAGIPTFIKAWKHPETETAFAYLTGIFGGVVGLAAAKEWNFIACAFPVSLVIFNGVLIVGIYRKSRA